VIRPYGHFAAALIPAAAAFAAFTSTAVGGTQSGSAPAAATEPTELREGAGRDLTVGRCIICHSVEYIPSNAAAMNRAAWQKTIQKMKDRFGAPITDDEAKQILDYLAANYSGKSG
jgi:mono/diheme cytochrome c family protein